jgi:hypothetical protein
MHCIGADRVKLVELVESSGGRVDVSSVQEGTWHGHVVGCRSHIAGSLGDGGQQPANKTPIR